MEEKDVLWRTRGWTGLTAVFVAALGALVIAPPVWADDTMPAPPIPAVSDVMADIDAGVAADEMPGAELVASEIADTVSEALSEPGASDITSDGADTARDIGDSRTEAVSAEGSGPAPANTGEGRDPGSISSSPTVQSAAANVNMSIRVDSPGNDGSVSQSNTTGTTAAGPSASTSSPTPSAQPVPPSSSGAAVGGGEWEWTWDCAQPPIINAPALVDASGEIVAWNWTWTLELWWKYPECHGAEFTVSPRN